MKNLDWSKINNGKDFQKLVNDLFALEINHPKYLSSNPEIGADGGWDGRYEGTYMGIYGIWCFQAKWTKHNLDNAYKQIYKELKEELRKAKENNVQHLLLATNADLRVGINDHIGKLEKLNKDKKYVENLFIWPRANLESRIIKYQILRYFYFDDPQEPMFVPPYIYANYEPFLAEIFVGREYLLKEFDNFVNDNSSNILILHSGGGYGKSHFIIEAGKRIKCSQKNSWFCRPGIRDVNEAINEIDHTKDTIIFLDDSERYLEETRKLISHSKTFPPGRLKLILSCRSSGKDIVQNLIDFQRIGKLLKIELPKLPENKLVEILYHVAYPKKVKYPERIVKELNGNLFLIVTIGKMLKGGTTVIDPEHLKKNIKINLEYEAINSLSELLVKRDVKRFLRELSVIVPFSKIKPNRVIEKLSSILKIDGEILDEAINRLIETKVLRIIGSSVRFNPDMNGDIYLSVEIDQIKGKELVNKIFENWLSIYPKQIVSNLAAASRHCETDTASDVVKELVKKWNQAIPQTSDPQKSRRLEMITPIAFLAPEETINLSYAYIDSSQSKEDNIYQLNQDTFGPIIYQILHISGFEESVLNLILYIAKKNLQGTYHNYKPATLIRQITSPIEIRITSAIKALSVILNWTIKKNCTLLEAKLAKEGACEALAGSHEYNESYGDKYTIGRKVLLYKEPFCKEIDRFRDKGMEILKSLIFHPNNKIKKLGIETVSDIGKNAESTNENLWLRIITDKERAIEWLSKSIDKDTPHELLSTIEDVLIKYWANDQIHRELRERVANILRIFPRTVEYIVFQYFVAHDLIIDDFSKIESSAPDQDRRTWLVNNHFRLHEFNQKGLDEVVMQLAKKYKTVEGIANYLNNLEREICGIAQWQYVPLIETWSKYNNEPFIEFANSVENLQSIPERFHLGICRVASDKDKTYVQRYAENILRNVSDLKHYSVENLIDLISRHTIPTELFMPWLIEIVKNADNFIKNLILHRSYFIFKNRSQLDKNCVGGLLIILLNNNIDSHALDMVNFLLRHAINWNIPKIDLERIRSRLFEIIKDIPSIEYHTDDLMKFAVTKDIDKFIELVEYRLKKDKSSFKEKIGERFEPIPYDGFRSVEVVVRNYEDFSKLMDKVDNWKNDEMLYSFDMDKMLKNIKSHDEKYGDYLTFYIDEKIEKGDSKSIRIASNVLLGVPFNKRTSDLFFKLLISAEKINLLEKAQETFTYKALSGSYSANVGEAPPALVNKKKTLIELHKNCKPGMIRDYLDSLIKSISSDIQWNIDKGEEFKSPKS
jgi:hypothetical protein